MRCPFAIWRPSPNYYEGRTQPISWVTQHSTVADLAGTLRIFDGLTSRNVSAHFTIALHEDAIYQHVDTDDTAWHAADQNENANPYSVGVEHVDDRAHWDSVRTEIQYRNSVRLNRWILETHGLGVEHIGRHRDRISTACPSGLDVERIIVEILGEEMTLQGDERQALFDLVTLGHQQKNALEAIATHIGVKAPLGVAPKKAKRPTAAEARAGHGKGR